MKKVSKKLAGKILVACLLFMILFHLGVIFKILPTDVVWGGQEADESKVIYLEILAIVITLFFMSVGAARAGFLKNGWYVRVSKVLVWVMVLYFSFNVIGNLMAKTMTEKLIFIPLTIILVFCSIRLALKD